MILDGNSVNFFVIIWLPKESSHISKCVINVDKKYLDTFLSKKMRLQKGIMEIIFRICSQCKVHQNSLFYTTLLLM